jgi:hypothetical protein
MNWLFYPILMVVLGGTGTVIGPVIGALIVTALFAYGDIYFGGVSPHHLRSSDHPGHEVHAGRDHEHHCQGAHALAAGRSTSGQRGRVGRVAGTKRRNPRAVVRGGPRPRWHW